MQLQVVDPEVSSQCSGFHIQLSQRSEQRGVASFTVTGRIKKSPRRMKHTVVTFDGGPLKIPSLFLPLAAKIGSKRILYFDAQKRAGIRTQVEGRPPAPPSSLLESKQFDGLGTTWNPSNAWPARAQPRSGVYNPKLQLRL